MADKSDHVQIRVTAAQKARLRRLAKAAGQDISAYVLAQVLPESGSLAQHAADALRAGHDRSFALAALGDALVPLSAGELERAVAELDVSGLSAFSRNYVAATVEYLCTRRGAPVPRWTRAVQPLDEPWFATPLGGLRLHLLRQSPVAFRRRNLFVDAGPDSRV